MSTLTTPPFVALTMHGFWVPGDQLPLLPVQFLVTAVAIVAGNAAMPKIATIRIRVAFM